jgi:hypothetical protein
MGPADGGGASEMTSRRLGGVGGLVIAAVLLVGCVTPLAGSYRDETDLVRLGRIWNDPWVAADQTAVRTPAVPDWVDRGGAIRRHTLYVSDALAVIREEIQAAASVGWELTGATCPSDDSAQITASLKKGGDELDRAAIAWIRVAFDEALTDDTGTLVTVEVEAKVPDSRDQSWPNPDAVPLENTCLIQASEAGSTQAELSNLPITNGGTTAQRQTAAMPSWWSAETAKTLAEKATALNDDPLLKELGIQPSMTLDWRDDVLSWAVPSGSASQEDTADSLARIVAEASSSDWTLVYSGCWPSGLKIAELRHGIDNEHTAALRMTQTPTAEPTRATLTATVTISSPQWGGPPTDPPETVASCWSEGTTPDTFKTTGTPWYGPTSIAPVLPVFRVK